MLSGSFVILLSNAVLALHLGNGSGSSFPRPLKSEEEKKYIDQWVTYNDFGARNKLIEHNLRLVVFLAKKYVNNKIKC